MESKIIVYKKVVPGANIDETIKKCLGLYEDKLSAGLSLGDRGDKEWYQKAFKIEELLTKHSEAFLPDRFKGKNYSRLKSVFAFPFEFPNEWCYPNLVPKNRSFADGETVIKMAVDGSDALVLPMYEVDVFYGNGNASSDNPRDMRRIRKIWESVVSLEEFTRDFVRPHKREYIWDSKYNRIEKPEVIIPEWSLEKISFLN